MKIIYTLILCFSIIGQTFAQKSGDGCELSGYVVDKITGEHLSFASIVLKGTDLSATTNESGYFALINIPLGEYTVVASMSGYLSSEKRVELRIETTNDITLSLVENVVELNTVVVSANRNETKRKEAPNIVNVLTPRVFEATNSNILSEGLSFMSGLRVENSCQNCGFQQVRINGLDGQYSQLLIDGRPIISALTGVYGIEQIPAGMINRVEVIRGGGSALYGSNAIGGIINIITNEPIENTGMLSHNLMMIGGESAENNTNLNASLVNENGRAGAYIFANIKSRTPYDANNDGYTEIAKLNATTAGFRAFYKPSRMSKLTMEYHNISEFRRGGDSLDLPPHEVNIAEQVEHNINGGGLKYDISSKDYKHKVSLYTSAQNTNRKSYYGAGKDPNAYGITIDLTWDAGGQYSYNFDKLLFMPANIIGGIEYNYDKLDDETPGYHRSTHQTVEIGSVFLQNEWKNEKLSILLGARLDKHNMIDNPIFSPRLNFRYNPISDISLRASYSEGFRAPQTFSEDLHILAAGGNVILIQLAPNLKPEHSKSISTSVDLYHTFGTVQTNLLVEGFYTDLSDVFVLEPIGTDADGNTIQEKRNGSGAVVKGFNLEAKAALNRNYQLQAGFTFQKSEYKELEMWSEDLTVAGHKNMFRTPDVYGYFTGTFIPVDDFSVSLSGTYTGPMDIQHFAGYISQDRVDRSSSFFDANIKLAYTFNLSGNVKAQISAGLQNIFEFYQSDFDKGANRDSGYIYGPMYPRSYFAGIKFTL